jgi:hypothetical protein
LTYLIKHELKNILIGGIVIALTGHYVSDWLEKKIPVDSRATAGNASNNLSSQITNTSQKT